MVFLQPLPEFILTTEKNRRHWTFIILENVDVRENQHRTHGAL
jgi:hypothetical protein